MSDNTKKCPYCAGEIHIEALKCKHCREFLDDDLRAARESKNQPQVDNKNQAKTGNDQQSNEKQKNNSSYIGWIFTGLVLIILGATMPFHYLPEHGMVFPKDNLTFSNTFIFQEDVDRLIERYNNASLFEQQAINEEPLARKLKEKGVIYSTDE